MFTEDGRGANAEGVRVPGRHIQGPGGHSQSSWQNLVKKLMAKGVVSVGAQSWGNKMRCLQAEMRKVTEQARLGDEEGYREGLGTC